MTYGLSIDEYFEPIDNVGYGIYDTENSTFVKTIFSGKSAWSKSNHAAAAFINACGYKITSQTRYEVRKF